MRKLTWDAFFFSCCFEMIREPRRLGEIGKLQIYGEFNVVVV